MTISYVLTDPEWHALQGPHRSESVQNTRLLKALRDKGMPIVGEHSIYHPERGTLSIIRDDLFAETTWRWDDKVEPYVADPFQVSVLVSDEDWQRASNVNLKAMDLIGMLREGGITCTEALAINVPKAMGELVITRDEIMAQTRYSWFGA